MYNNPEEIPTGKIGNTCTCYIRNGKFSKLKANTLHAGRGCRPVSRENVRSAVRADRLASGWRGGRRGRPCPRISVVRSRARVRNVERCDGAIQFGCNPLPPVATVRILRAGRTTRYRFFFFNELDNESDTKRVRERARTPLRTN